MYCSLLALSSFLLKYWYKQNNKNLDKQFSKRLNIKAVKLNIFKKLNFSFLFLVTILICQNSYSQIIDSLSLSINTRLSFYTTEKEGELLLHVPPALLHNNLVITINLNNEVLAKWHGKVIKNPSRIPFNIGLVPDNYKITAVIESDINRHIRYLAETRLIILEYKSNEVKTDRLTGGLVVNGRQFFPFGFYCYSPVYPTLPEEEVVNGFNMISPYQKIEPESINDRKSYMDRCAELGIKVHYNLLSVSGGGGVGSKSMG